MRIIGGGPRSYNKETITGKMLLEYGYKNPDFLPTILRTPDLRSPFISILDQKGMKSDGLNYGSNFLNSNYRAVGSNVIEYRIENKDIRKEKFKANPDGYTFVDEANPTQPGLNKNEFYVYLDSDYLGYQEVFVLADNDTQLWVIGEGGKEMSNGSYEYRVKLVSNELADYVNIEMMTEGYEVMLGQTLHEQELSTRANEVRMNTAAIGRTFLSLQRVKYSYSGTAQAMDKSGKTSPMYQVAHVAGGMKQSLYLSEAEMQMMKDVARFTEFQILEGKSTASQKDFYKVLLRNAEGKEVLAGDGVMHANDGPIEFPMPKKWTKGFLEAFMAEIDPHITEDRNGKREVFLGQAPRAYQSFQQLMTEMGQTMNDNIEGSGAEKGIVDTYSFYELAGVRIISQRIAAFADRPGIYLKDGSKTSDWTQYAIPLGLTKGGRNGVEIVTLRPMVKGTIAGINEGGDVASSVDGTHKHVLWQIGVASQIQPILLNKPYSGNIL